ncbi:hypothetical protein ACOI6D_25825, partial [Klebsiella sp. R2]
MGKMLCRGAAEQTYRPQNTGTKEDFGGFYLPVQPLKTVKIEQIVQLHGEKGEKSPFRKKDRKKACAKKWDPYNAHPL